MSSIVNRPYYPSLLITPENTRDRNGPVALTESGAVRRVPFDGGQAFFVEEGTTNLIRNPMFTTVPYWSGGQGLRAFHGDGSCTITDISTQSDILYSSASNSIPVTGGASYTISMWLKPA